MNLTEYSRKTEEIINDAEYRPLKPADLAALLGIESGSEDETAFFGLLHQLERSGVVAITKRGKVTSPRAVGLISGVFRGTSKHFGFVTPDGEEGNKNDIFIPASKTLCALDGDRVLVHVENRIDWNGQRGKAHFDERRFKRMRNGKLVPKRDEEKKNNKGLEGEVVRITERNPRKIIGVFYTTIEIRGRKQKKISFVQPDSKRLPYSIFVSEKDSLSAKENDKVELVITKYPSENSDLQGRITRVFGNSEGKQANYEAILAEHEIRTEFSEEVIAEAQKCSSMPIIPNNRQDLRDKIIFTIDGADAKDLDDAISLEMLPGGKYKLGVHIADVSEYVREGSALDMCAMERGTSVYFTDKVVPMLPKSLSNGSCSLNPLEDRYALSAFVILDQNGEILECEPCESIICSSVRGVYSEVNDLFEKGKSSDFYEKYKAVYPMLCNMHKLYKVLKTRSEERGAVELETSEAQIIVDKNGYPIDIVARERGDAEKMIEQFMLCANESVATWLTQLSLPCVYRVHEAPSPDKLQDFSAFAGGIGLDTRHLRAKTLFPSAYATILDEAKEKGLGSVLSVVMLRSMMKAKYSSVAGPHFGLAIDMYCHFTSPIRRYPDLSVHRIVKTALRGEMTDKKLSSLSKFAGESAARSSENELRALGAERDIDDLYKVLYMSDRVGCEFDGVVGSVTAFGMFITLPNTVEGLVPIETLDGRFVFDEKNYILSFGKKAYKLGQSVRVRIESADIPSRKILMSICEDE